MAGNKKQKRKKKPTTKNAQPVQSSRKRISFAQIAFIAFGVLIILSMVISLVANFITF